MTDAYPSVRRAAVVATLLALAVPSFPAVPAASGVEAGAPFVPGELIIAFERGVTDAQVADFHDDFKLEEDEDLDADPRDRDPEETLTDVPAVTDALIARVESDPRVDYAEPNYILSADVTPTDPEYGRLWGLNNTGQTGGTPDADIDAPEAWAVTTGSADVVVGVIDSGVNYAHQDLAPNMWVNPGEVAGNGIDDDANGYVDDIHGINAITGSGNPADDHGHGTHVSGTIAGAGNNGIGVTGVAWNARIAGCKFLSSTGSGSTSNAIKCFKYFNALKNRAVNPVNVVLTNNSWGGGGFSQALQDAMLGLDQPGMPRILHLCAAGNANLNNDAGSFYPSSYPIDNVLSVAASDHNDRYASFSNWGATSVDLAAPGTSIYSTYIPGNAYTSMSGTSMATPHVAGAAAVVSAVNPGMSSAALKERLMASVDPIGGLSGNSAKPTVTNGRLNLMRAIGTDPDVTAPASATIGTGSVTSTSVTLSWTATGDDGTDGTATSYDLRYSTSPITDASWASATKVTGEPTPKASGSAETFIVPGLAPSTAYHFALKVADDFGNESALSNVATATTTAAPQLLQVTDSWDQRNNRTGTVSTVQTSDNNRVSVYRNYLWSFQFADPGLPAGATVQGVTIHVEHHEESGFSGSVAWQVHTGSLTSSNPVALQSLNAPIRIGSSNERTDAFDVSASINETAELAAMKLVVRNNGTTSARTRIDRVYAEVTYSIGPDSTPPETTISSGPSGTVNSATASFAYASSEAGSSFACSLDGAEFTSCPATGITYPGLAEGSHNFEVQATDADGNTDTSPASRPWTIDVTAPQVVDPTTPASGASDVSVDTQVKATFSEEMSASTITGSSFTLTTSSGGAVAGTVGYDAASRTATFTPSAPLAAGTSYTARVTTAARDVAGNALAAEKSWSFTTAAAADTTAPDTTITSGPSGRVSSASATFTYESTESGSNFACRIDGGAFATCPADGITYPALADGSHTFDVQATDAAGNTDGSPAGRTWTVDTVAPQVVDPTIPAGGATGIAVSTQVKATFNEEMTASTITASSFTLEETSSGSSVTASITYDAASRTATLTPTATLATSTSYTAQIATAAKDLAGNPLAAAETWSFTTAAAADTTPPNTTITSGPSGRVTSASATFTYESTESGSTFACRLDGASFATCPATGITYPDLADGSHTFEVRATDAANNTGTPASRTWTVDTVAPQVLDPTIPAAGASGVSVSTQVKATFSEEMTASTITGSSFTLTASSGGAVSGTVGYDAASRTASFTPAAALAASTSYTAQITTAAKDLAGNALAAAKTWSFTTAAPAAGQTLYLHNQPSPPVGNTTAQKHMAMNATAPTATTLYQYSTDLYTGAPGRSVEKSSANAGQAEAKYMANWVYQVATYTAFSSSAELKVWVAMKDLKCDKTPSFTVYLREKTSSTTDAGALLATATATSPPPGGSEPCNFRLLTVTLPTAGTDVAAGSWLELKISVNESTGDSALLAYDTTVYAATLRLP